MVGIITLARALILSKLVEEREDFELKRRHKVAAVAIGATTGFVIGITSAGSGTVIAILLIAVYRLVPRKVVGTDVFHAAILLWAAGIAHWVGGNVDFVLAGNILLGSVPGVVVGAQFRGPGADRVPAQRPRGRPDRLWAGHRAEGRPGRLADRRRGRRDRPRPADLVPALVERAATEARSRRSPARDRPLRRSDA